MRKSRLAMGELFISPLLNNRTQENLVFVWASRRKELLVFFFWRMHKILVLKDNPARGATRENLSRSTPCCSSFYCGRGVLERISRFLPLLNLRFAKREFLCSWSNFQIRKRDILTNFSPFLVIYFYLGCHCTHWHSTAVVNNQIIRAAENVWCSTSAFRYSSHFKFGPKIVESTWSCCWKATKLIQVSW